MFDRTIMFDRIIMFAITIIRYEYLRIWQGAYLIEMKTVPIYEPSSNIIHKTNYLYKQTGKG